MSENLVTALVSIVVALIGLAALATVLSPKAATSQVIGAGSQGLATDITAAVSPVAGGGLGSLPSLSMPSMGNGL
jgi:hypothetical protein